MEFEKWQACGNDFILLRGDWDFEEKLECMEREARDKLVKRLCDRNYGIGADGILLLLPSDEAQVRMRVLNRDGSEAEMCGNGIRCLVKSELWRREDEDSLFVETGAGIKYAAFEGDYITVDMGRGQVKWAGEMDLPPARTYRTCWIDVGNPHCVVFMHDVIEEEFEKYAPLLSTLPRFPEGANVEFVGIYTTRRIRARVWERGVGRTLACGTGACAAAFAAYKAGATTGSVTVTLDGGDVDIEIDEEDNIRMIGPCELVYRGEIDLELPEVV